MKCCKCSRRASLRVTTSSGDVVVCAWCVYTTDAGMDAKKWTTIDLGALKAQMPAARSWVSHRMRLSRYLLCPPISSHLAESSPLPSFLSTHCGFYRGRACSRSCRQSCCSWSRGLVTLLHIVAGQHPPEGAQRVQSPHSGSFGRHL
jgi:hypothetical protein